MNKLVLTLVVLWTLPVLAVLEVGDTVPNFCWMDENEAKFCLEDAKDTVRLLNFNTGWCPACNDEMPKIVSKAKEYTKLPVTILSLSAASFENGGAPTPEFLKEWKEKHSIPFRVLASPKDPGRRFFAPPYSIPAFVILDKAGKLAYKSMEAGMDDVFKQLDQLL